MRRIVPWAGMTLALAVFVPLRAADEKKEDLSKLPRDKTEATQKLVTGGELIGKIVKWGEDQKYFTLQVSLRYATPNVGAINNLASLQREALEVSLNRGMTPIDRQRRLADLSVRIAQAQRNAYSVKEESLNLELEPVEDLKVRWLEPPPAVDDKGNLRKRTAAELRELRGPDRKLPGYLGDPFDLRTGQYVRVYLKKPDKPKGSRDADDLLSESKPQVVMILILGEERK